jgi:hypothetical protein
MSRSRASRKNGASRRLARARLAERSMEQRKGEYAQAEPCDVAGSYRGKEKAHSLRYAAVRLEILGPRAPQFATLRPRGARGHLDIDWQPRCIANRQRSLRTSSESCLCSVARRPHRASTDCTQCTRKSAAVQIWSNKGDIENAR